METAKRRTPAEFLRALSVVDFLAFGLNQIGYIRRHHAAAEDGDGNAFGLYAANGRLITVEKTPEEAVRYALQNDIAPVTVH